YRRGRLIGDEIDRTALELPRGGECHQLMKFGPFPGNPRFVAIKTRFRVAPEVGDLTAHELGQQLLPATAVLVVECDVLIGAKRRLEGLRKIEERRPQLPL